MREPCERRARRRTEGGATSALHVSGKDASTANSGALRPFPRPPRSPCVPGAGDIDEVQGGSRKGLRPGRLSYLGKRSVWLSDYAPTPPNRPISHATDFVQ